MKIYAVVCSATGNVIGKFLSRGTGKIIFNDIDLSILDHDVPVEKREVLFETTVHLSSSKESMEKLQGLHTDSFITEFGCGSFVLLARNPQQTIELCKTVND